MGGFIGGGGGGGGGGGSTDPRPEPETGTAEFGLSPMASGIEDLSPFVPALSPETSSTDFNTV